MQSTYTHMHTTCRNIIICEHKQILAPFEIWILSICSTFTLYIFDWYHLFWFRFHNCPHILIDWIEKYKTKKKHCSIFFETSLKLRLFEKFEKVFIKIRKDWRISLLRWKESIGISPQMKSKIFRFLPFQFGNIWITNWIPFISRFFNRSETTVCNVSYVYVIVKFVILFADRLMI